MGLSRVIVAVEVSGGLAALMLGVFRLGDGVVVLVTCVVAPTDVLSRWLMALGAVTITSFAAIKVFAGRQKKRATTSAMLICCILLSVSILEIDLIGTNLGFAVYTVSKLLLSISCLSALMYVWQDITTIYSYMLSLHTYSRTTIIVRSIAPNSSIRANEN